MIKAQQAHQGIINLPLVLNDRNEQQPIDMATWAEIPKLLIRKYNVQYHLLSYCDCIDICALYIMSFDLQGSLL
jgi:hypothetical protein